MVTWILLTPPDDPRLLELGWRPGPLPFGTGTVLGHALGRIRRAGGGQVIVVLPESGGAHREAAALRESPPGLDVRVEWFAPGEDWHGRLAPWLVDETWWWDLDRISMVNLEAVLAEAAGRRDEPRLLVVADERTDEGDSGGRWTGLARLRGTTDPGGPWSSREGWWKAIAPGAGQIVCAAPAFDLSQLEDYRAAALSALPPTRHIAEGARVHPSARLEAPVWIDPGVQIEEDARIGPHVRVGAGSVIGRGAIVERTWVGPATRVGPGTTWREGLLGPRGSWHAGPVWAHPDELAPVGGQDPSVPTIQRLLALVALGVLSPVLVAIALAIWLDDPGPVLFTQLRAGGPRLGRSRVFPLFKFRTMRIDAERIGARLREQHGGTFMKLVHDPRLTRLGAWLRRTSLDELPQLINVVRGELRLVGNRPLPLYEARALRESWQRKRFEGPAGITGLWQTHGRSDLDEVERLALDALYATGRNPWRDLRLLLRTLPALFGRRGAR